MDTEFLTGIARYIPPAARTIATPAAFFPRGAAWPAAVHGEASPAAIAEFMEPRSRRRSHLSGICEIIADRSPVLAGKILTLAGGPESAVSCHRREEGHNATEICRLGRAGNLLENLFHGGLLLKAQKTSVIKGLHAQRSDD
jgi:hypothetical protein